MDDEGIKVRRLRPRVVGDAINEMHKVLYARRMFDFCMAYEDGKPVKWEDIQGTYQMSTGYQPQFQYQKGQ